VTEEASEVLIRYKRRLESLDAKLLDEGLTAQEGLELSALRHAIKYLKGATPSAMTNGELHPFTTKKQDLFSDYLKKAGRPQSAKAMCRDLAARQHQWTFRDLWQGLNDSIRKESLVVTSGERGDKIVSLPIRERTGPHKKSQKKPLKER
jgi:hypothetical protein